MARPLFVLAFGCAALCAVPAAMAQSPDALREDSWITLSGTVSAVQNGSFTIRYPGGQIRVEAEEWGPRTHQLSPGERVIVNGVVDGGFLENKTIEAHTVRVPARNVMFFADIADLDDLVDFEGGALTAEEDTIVSVQGVVTQIDNAQEFTLRSGKYAIRVDTDEMPYNPLSRTNGQGIGIGERVRVVGKVDHDLFEQDEVKALSVLAFRGMKPSSSQ